MFHTFDKVLLLSEGHPVYYGKARESMDYFSCLRFVPEIAMNPAEFLLDLATGQVNDIRVPDELLASQEAAAELEKAVIRVRDLLHNSHIYIFFKTTSIGSINHIFHPTVPTT